MADIKKELGFNKTVTLYVQTPPKGYDDDGGYARFFLYDCQAVPGYKGKMTSNGKETENKVTVSFFMEDNDIDIPETWTTKSFFLIGDIREYRGYIDGDDLDGLIDDADGNTDEYDGGSFRKLDTITEDIAAFIKEYFTDVYTLNTIAKSDTVLPHYELGGV